MTAEQPSEHLQLDGFVSYPREDIDLEYKGWLNLRLNKDRATLAKAAIALANHGGGHIILGFQEGGALQSVARPPDVPVITQDDVNEAIRRYAEPEFHCQMYDVTHPQSGVTHPVIGIPGSNVPVMCKRDQQDSGVSQYTYYVRKPGPRSEGVHTADEWRRLLDRCIRARREDMLDSIRSIVLGRAEDQDSPPEPLEALTDYCTAAYERWTELVSGLPGDSPSRFPYGFYEMGFALGWCDSSCRPRGSSKTAWRCTEDKAVGMDPVLGDDWRRLEALSFDRFIEAWIGRPVDRHLWNDPFHSDFWRASVDGELYTIRGYVYDGPEAQERGHRPGGTFNVEMPIRRIAEGILFAGRFAEEFVSVEQVAIRCKFAGLSARSLAPTDASDPIISGQYVCNTREVVSTNQVTLQQVRDNLPEVVHGLLQRLFEEFGFYRLYLTQVQSSLQQMRRYE